MSFAIVHIVLLGAAAPAHFTSFAQMEHAPTHVADVTGFNHMDIDAIVDDEIVGNMDSIDEHVELTYAGEVSSFELSYEEAEFLEKALDEMSDYEDDALPHRSGGILTKLRTELTQKQKIELLIREKAMSIRDEWVERIAALGGQLQNDNIAAAAQIYNEYHSGEIAELKGCVKVSEYAQNHYYLFNAMTPDPNHPKQILEFEQMNGLCSLLDAFYKHELMSDRRFALKTFWKGTSDVQHLTLDVAHMIYWHAEETLNGTQVRRVDLLVDEYGSYSASDEDEETKQKKQLLQEIFIRMSFDDQVQCIRFLADPGNKVFSNKEAYHQLLDKWFIDKAIVDLLVSNQGKVAKVTKTEKKNRKAFLKHIIDHVLELVAKTDITSLEDKDFDFQANAAQQERYNFALMATVIYGIWTAKDRTNKDRRIYVSRGKRDGWRKHLTEKLLLKGKEATARKRTMYNFLQFITGMSRQQEDEKMVSKKTLFDKVLPVAASNKDLYKPEFW